MRIFLSGATGYVGAAALGAFVRHGHEVVALVRHPGKAERLASAGVTTVIGDVTKPDSYVASARTCDVLVHTAFDRSARGPLVDGASVAALLDVARERRREGLAASIIYTSNTWVLGEQPDGADEDAALRPTPFVAWRLAQEQALVSDAKAAGVRTVIVRPGIVYGGAEGLVGELVKNAANGLIRVVGDGRNRWPCVYDRDLADLYVRLAVHSEAEGVFHATDHGDERVLDIVDAIAAHARMRPDVRLVPLPEARAKLGPYADALALDQVVRSPRARALGWTPTLHSISGSVARLLEEFRASREAAA
jgi:nucleoside-diphosphate-sugar epimerase